MHRIDRRTGDCAQAAGPGEGVRQLGIGLVETACPLHRPTSLAVGAGCVPVGMNLLHQAVEARIKLCSVHSETGRQAEAGEAITRSALRYGGKHVLKR